jgi:hypothetical protein
MQGTVENQRVEAASRIRLECSLEYKHSAGIFKVAHSVCVLYGVRISFQNSLSVAIHRHGTAFLREKVPRTAEGLGRAAWGKVSADKYLSLRCHLVTSALDFVCFARKSLKFLRLQGRAVIAFSALNISRGMFVTFPPFSTGGIRSSYFTAY